MRSVGYRQVWQHLEGEFDRNELKDRAIYATRQLAKRQMTWLRSWPECSVFDCFDPRFRGGSTKSSAALVNGPGSEFSRMNFSAFAEKCLIGEKVA